MRCSCFNPAGVWGAETFFRNYERKGFFTITRTKEALDIARKKK